MTRRTRSQVLKARKNAVCGGCCNRFADQQGCECLAMAEPDPFLPDIDGYRGEPWTCLGRTLYDRDGVPFASVYPGGEEFARTICLAVNLLANVPLRPEDGPLTNEQQLALLVLRDSTIEATRE